MAAPLILLNIALSEHPDHDPLSLRPEYGASPSRVPER
jgi:hypothetical protein